MGSPEASSRRPFWKLGRRPIGQQLAVLVLVATLPSFLFVIWHLVSDRERDGQLALDQVRQLADNAANRVQASLNDYANTLTLIAEQPLVKVMDPGVCDPLINSFVRLNPEFVTIGTRDLQGHAVCTFLASPPTGAQVVAFPWFQEALRAGTFHASDVFYAPLDRRWVTVLSTPIRNDAHAQIGMVVMPLDLLPVSQMVMKDVPSHVRVSVLDRQYRVMMRSGALSEMLSKPAALQLDVLRAAVQVSPIGFVEMRDEADEAQIIAYQRLPGTEWLVSAGLPRDAIFAAADTALRNGVLGSIALLVLALGLAWRLARSIVRPLEAILATTHRIAAGDMDARVQQPRASSDVAELGEAFNHMLQARQQAERALRENEENLAITLHSIGDAVIATDREGRVMRMNPAAERLTGWDRAQADGRPLGEVFRIASVQGGVLADPVQQVLATGEMVGLANDTELLSRDGTRYHIADRAAPIRDKDGTLVGVVLVFSDVSAQYVAQRDLREAFNFFRQILDNLPLGLNVMDAQGRYLEWNPAMEAIRGRTKEEMLGRTVAETYPREPAAMYDEVMDAVARAMQGEEVLRPDVPISGADHPVWTTVRHAPVRNAQGTVTGSLSIVHDVTERKLAELQLRASEQSLAITLQSIGDAVMATDLQGRVTRMNPAAERLTGWTLADGVGRPLIEVFRIVHAVTREVPMDPVQRVLASGEVVGLANHTALLSRDGLELHISDSAAPIRDAEGNMVGVVLVFSNVTEQYRLQQVLLESEERYRALVDAFPVAVVVHQHERVVFVNPAAVRLLVAGSAAALLGRSIADFVHPDDHLLLARRAQQVQADLNDLPMQEWRYLRLDGSVIDVQAQATVIELDGEAAVQVSFMDITARKQAEARLRENEARFRALASLSSDWYWEQDAQYRFVRVAVQDAELTGHANRPHMDNEYIGRKRWELAATQLTPLQWDEHRADLDARREFRDLQVRFELLDGTHRWASISGMPIFDEHGTFCGYRGIGRAITAQKAAEEQINALAFYDALTHLPNRRLLIEQLKQALVSHARSHKHGALLFIDLDNFKTLNDTLGHETGDQLLMQVAQRLLSCVREADTVARLGGDEFVVMLQELSTQALDAAANAEHIGHNILAAFAPMFQLSGREYRSTPSIGITLYGDGNQSVEDLLKQADLAMYQAKAVGRNTLRMFDEGMQAAVDARAAMESDLRQAIVLRQFVLHYQPVVDKAGLVSGAEALVRWEHPVRGRVAPGDFIPLAESTRLIVPLGLWVLDVACAQLAQWGTSARTRHLSLAVNVSAHQFMEPDFVSQVVEALERSGADPQRLKLELTESLLADSIDDVIHKMSALRVRGVNFSLDDFGTGYSSLSYLKLLPLAHLKIDQSFVRDLLVDPNDAAIARTIVALAASLGLAVIAEGVETEGQYQLLLEMGCETFQGYWFAKPVPIAEFDALLGAPLPR